MIPVIGKLFLKLLGGSRNERIVKSRMKFVLEQVNPLEPTVQAMSDEQLRARSLELRKLRAEGTVRRDDIRAEAFALIREASRRARNHRHFDVQLVAAQILDEGWISEASTGEGKTIACYPAIYMAVLDGLKAHVVTTNDYLVQRDAEFAAPIFELLGVSVGFITSAMPAYGGAGVRKDAYQRDVIYGMNSEFGFDYLRDNTKSSTEEQVQTSLDFAIIDEVDSILIDEARTPLIISGPARGDAERFRKADAVARELVGRNRAWENANNRVEALKREIKSLQGELHKGDAETVRKRLAKAHEQMDQAEADQNACVRHYEVERDKKAAHLTHEGVTVAQEIAGVGSFYVGTNMEWPHLMENALRAHVVYERDVDYVVQNGEIVIVDTFTGRLMEGRQWSDGLHQAVEAKERVKVKEETQTIATVTIQNYFKMYKKLAGMTGTAMTEANEFMKIYKLDVGAVPTHRPVNRVDHNDKIYATVDDKFNAIVEEIHDYSSAGRPVLVGTTSVEKSERLSQALTRRYGIEHEVLNARPENVARESDIVAKAGQQHPLKSGSSEMVGNVTIATNMAGRGTDIKLAPAVVWPHCKVPPAEKLAELGVKPEELFPSGTNKCCIHCQQYNAATDCAHCFKPKLDPDFPRRGRTECCAVVPCGLHIVGTERHEARRIDNQLRGRAGRQGDPGSSRFFLSLRDDLMSIFAGEATLKLMGRLGLVGSESIEHGMVSRGTAKAQKKVEERNFEIRKNLLDYDEVMDYQRHAFYGQRQRVLKGQGLDTMVREMLDKVIDDATAEYLGGRYAAKQLAEWARNTLQMPVRDDQLKFEGPEDEPRLDEQLRTTAKEEAGSVINMTLGEYMDEETPPEEWDVKGMASWAMSRFGVNLSQAKLRSMTPDEVEATLSEAAAARINEMDLSGMEPYLHHAYSQRMLAKWATDHFGVEVKSEDLGEEGLATPETAGAALRKVVATMYHRLEVNCPVEFILERTVATAGTDNAYALEALAQWANRKYDAGFSAETLKDRKVEEIGKQLQELSERWSRDETIQRAVKDAVGNEPKPGKAVEFAKTRFDTELDLSTAERDGNAFDALVRAGRQFIRREVIELERFVLLQIFDTAWVDHLLAMDQLRSGIGLRGYAERDPRVAFKSEGSSMFQEMFRVIRDKVTDMIFKVHIRAGERVRNVYNVSSQVHQQLQGYDHLSQNLAEQAAASTAPKKLEPIRREEPKVGRNDPCPCGSGKKYKQCHGRDA